MEDNSHPDQSIWGESSLHQTRGAPEWHIPTEKVITGWRLLVPAEVMESIFWRAAGPLIGDDEPSAVMLAGMMVLAADGMLVNLGAP